MGWFDMGKIKTYAIVAANMYCCIIGTLISGLVLFENTPIALLLFITSVINCYVAAYTVDKQINLNNIKNKKPNMVIC